MLTGESRDQGLIFDLWIIRRVILDNPIHLRNIQTSGSHICTQQHTTLSLTKLQECAGPLLLLLLTLGERGEREVRV